MEGLPITVPYSLFSKIKMTMWAKSGINGLGVNESVGEGASVRVGGTGVGMADGAVVGGGSEVGESVGAMTGVGAQAAKKISISPKKAKRSKF